MCKYNPLLGKLPYGQIFLIIFDQPFIAQLILPNMKKKTVKIIQLLGNKFPTRFNKYCWLIYSQQLCKVICHKLVKA